MDLKNVKRFGKNVMNQLGKRSPIILAALGVGSGVATVALTIRATVKAVDLIEEERCARVERDEPTEMTKMEVVKVAWKPYIPVMVTGAFSIACMVGSCSVHARRNAALAAAYKVSETALINFKEATLEEIGEKKTDEIQKKAATKHMENTPVASSEVVMIGNGTVLCFDDLSGRYFKSDRETIRAAVNDCNFILQMDMYVSLNEFYDRIGLPGTTFGESAGWNVDQYPFHVIFGSKIADDGQPCMTIAYNVDPKYDYTRLY